MASRIFHDLLLQRHDHLSGLERQIFWVLVGLLGVHLVIVTPFLSAWHHSQEAATEVQRLADIGPGIDATVQRLDRLRDDYLASLQPALEEQIQGLELDLSRLEASRWQWQQDTPEATEEKTAEPSDVSLDRSLVMSEPPRGVVPFPMPETLLLKLRQAGNRYALLTVLEPWVEEQIVRPRMQVLQRTWNTETLPILSAELNAVGDEVSTWRARLPEAQGGWDAVSAALSKMASEAGDWTAQPPSQPFWWASPESEPRLVLGLGPHREALSQPPTLARLAVQQQELRQRLNEVAGTWKLRWTEVASTGSAPQGWLRSWFPKTQSWMPVALGMFFALLIWGHDKASKSLAAAVDRAVAYGSPKSLVSWCGARISGYQGLGTPESGLRRQFLVQTAAALLWIGVAAYQILGLPNADWTPWYPTLIVAILLLAMAVYRLISLQKAIGQLKVHLEDPSDSEPPPSNLLEDDQQHAEENPVEIALRR